MEKPNIIYGVFKNFFGEEFVDMQNYPSLDEYINNAKMLHSEEFMLKLQLLIQVLCVVILD